MVVMGLFGYFTKTAVAPVFVVLVLLGGLTLATYLIGWKMLAVIASILAMGGALAFQSSRLESEIRRRN
jgi:hypothetical protein